MTAQDPSTDLENVNAAYRAMREERDRAMAEVERLRELAIENGACYCTWDFDDDGAQVIVRPAEDCPVHEAAKEDGR